MYERQVYDDAFQARVVYLCGVVGVSMFGLVSMCVCVCVYAYHHNENVHCVVYPLGHN